MAFIAIETETAKLTRSGQRYRVYHDGEVLLESSKEPFGESARALLALGGCDVDDTLVQYDKATGAQHLSARIGYAASRMIVESSAVPIHSVPWRPFDRFRDEEEDE